MCMASLPTRRRTRAAFSAATRSLSSAPLFHVAGLNGSTETVLSGEREALLAVLERLGVELERRPRSRPPSS